MSTATAHRPLVRSGPPDSDGLITRIKSEFREMPGLSLTHVQAQRLWQLDERTCHTVLTRLVSAGFLQLTPKGHYKRS